VRAKAVFLCVCAAASDLTVCGGLFWITSHTSLVLKAILMGQSKISLAATRRLILIYYLSLAHRGAVLYTHNIEIEERRDEKMKFRQLARDEKRREE
jgi:hypothetical protein